VEVQGQFNGRNQSGQNHAIQGRRPVKVEAVQGVQCTRHQAQEHFEVGAGLLRGRKQEVSGHGPSCKLIVEGNR